jgi:hypothetical protein
VREPSPLVRAGDEGSSPQHAGSSYNQDHDASFSHARAEASTAQLTGRFTRSRLIYAARGDALPPTRGRTAALTTQLAQLNRLEVEAS